MSLNPSSPAAPTGTYNAYAPMNTPCKRIQILRNIVEFFSSAALIRQSHLSAASSTVCFERNTRTALPYESFAVGDDRDRIRVDTTPPAWHNFRVGMWADFILPYRSELLLCNAPSAAQHRQTGLSAKRAGLFLRNTTEFKKNYAGKPRIKKSPRNLNPQSRRQQPALRCRGI